MNLAKVSWILLDIPSVTPSRANSVINKCRLQLPRMEGGFHPSDSHTCGGHCPQPPQSRACGTEGAARRHAATAAEISSANNVTEIVYYNKWTQRRVALGRWWFMKASLIGQMAALVSSVISEISCIVAELCQCALYSLRGQLSTSLKWRGQTAEPAKRDYIRLSYFSII